MFTVTGIMGISDLFNSRRLRINVEKLIPNIALFECCKASSKSDQVVLDARDLCRVRDSLDDK